MGYIDSIQSQYFKETKDGKTVFYPWGFPFSLFTKGYILNNPQNEKSLRKKIVLLLILSIFLPGFYMIAIYFISSSLFYPIILLHTALVFFVHYFLYYRSVYKIPETVQSLKSEEHLVHIATSLGGNWIIAIGTICFFIVLCSLFVFFFTSSSAVKSLSVFCFMMFGSITILYCYLLKLWSTNQNTNR